MIYKAIVQGEAVVAIHAKDLSEAIELLKDVGFRASPFRDDRSRILVEGTKLKTLEISPITDQDEKN